jgi:hypothetical protein
MPETTYLDTETAYWVIPADDAFSVEVVTPWDDPTTVTPFATAADVKVWIAEHRRGVQCEQAEPSSYRPTVSKSSCRPWPSPDAQSAGDGAWDPLSRGGVDRVCGLRPCR